jgi:perosamine synthetase|tara:strand:+ start:1691 stop:2815 length:1125 start_codon:yes stop_codon:yes gene_type:complete
MGRKQLIPICEPDVTEGNEEKYVLDALKSGWISSIGSYVTRFEQEFSSYCLAKYGVTVSNGTAALHLALLALDVGKGDEVVIPDLTFASTANAVLYTGATPVLADVGSEIWNLSSESFASKITSKTKAVIAVHLYGHPCEMDSISSIARDNKIYVIEDAAQAHGAEYKGKRVGMLGDIGCFSFYGNKIITTGEGGMCITNDSVLEEKMRVLRDHGMSKERKYWHESIGFNYRITNLQAAVGVAQLEQIENFIKRKRNIALQYDKFLESMKKHVIFPVQKEWAKSVYWLYTVLLRGSDQKTRDDVIKRIRGYGIDVRPTFYPVSMMPPYRKLLKAPNPVSKQLGLTGISLPSGIKMDESRIREVADAFKKSVCKV